MKTAKNLLFILVVLCISCGTSDPASKYPNMLADLDPYSLGSVEISLERLFSSALRETNAELIFYPRENRIALEYQYELITYRQFWDEKSRQCFIDGLNRFRDDYYSHRLINRYNRTKAAYGTCRGQAQWQSFQFAAVYTSSPVFELGYRFRQDKPYFSVLQNSAKAESGMYGEPGVRSNSNQDSRQVIIYFSLGQAGNLAAVFDREFLLESLETR